MAVPADATRDRIADDLRRLSPAVLQALTEISLPVCIFDREGVVTWQNIASLEIFGDKRGAHFIDCMSPEGQLVARESFARTILGSDGATSFDGIFMTRTGKRLHAEVETVRLEGDSRLIGVFGILTVEKFIDPAAGADWKVHLTPRQVQVLKLLAQGRSTVDIADGLHLSIETVRNHVRSVLKALRVHSRVEALARARELDIL
jgi:DNA-binding CsgD family transcriptional regulator